MVPDSATAQASCLQVLAPAAHVRRRDARQVLLRPEVLDRPLEVQLRELEPRIGHLRTLGLRLEMGAGEICEGRLRGEPVQCPASPEPVDLLEPAREEHLRRCRVRGRTLLAPRDKGLPAAADVGVLPQVRIGASRAAAVSPVDVGSGLHVSLRC